MQIQRKMKIKKFLPKSEFHSIYNQKVYISHNIIHRKYYSKMIFQFRTFSSKNNFSQSSFWFSYVEVNGINIKRLRIRSTYTSTQYTYTNHIYLYEIHLPYNFIVTSAIYIKRASFNKLPTITCNKIFPINYHSCRLINAMHLITVCVCVYVCVIFFF